MFIVSEVSVELFSELLREVIGAGNDFVPVIQSLTVFVISIVLLLLIVRRR